MANKKVKTVTLKHLGEMLKKHSQSEVAKMLGVTQPCISYHARQLADAKQRKVRFVK